MEYFRFHTRKELFHVQEKVQFSATNRFFGVVFVYIFSAFKFTNAKPMEPNVNKTTAAGKKVSINM
jgi:hypothetical protein